MANQGREAFNNFQMMGEPLDITRVIGPIDYSPLLELVAMLQRDCLEN